MILRQGREIIRKGPDGDATVESRTFTEPSVDLIAA
jgi:hypothetical protein